MNAAVRAVARTAFFEGWEVMGVNAGYRGLLEGRIYPMDRRRLGGIVHRGGTVLGTERAPEMVRPEGQRRAAGNLEEAGVEALVVIGGNGSLAGGQKLAELGVKVVGIPASIDNDVWGTDLAIGVDTALNTALEAIDRIKDTASSHRRAHVVEVMGRDCGYLALMSAIAGGAEARCWSPSSSRDRRRSCRRSRAPGSKARRTSWSWQRRGRRSRRKISTSI